MRRDRSLRKPWAAFSWCAAVFLTLGVGAAGATTSGATTPGTHPDAPGIAWFEGDVAAAFAAAAKEHKPVFLYWGAKWCPPCQEVKAWVFSREDFIAKSKEFVAVYLDGDDAGAQRWGEKFKVLGYPTLVLLRPDQVEIMRISGGIDLSSYANVLDLALTDVRPIAEVRESIEHRSAKLSHSDCQRLVYNEWEVQDMAAAERSKLAAQLARAASGCMSLTAAEHARLDIVIASAEPTADSAARVVQAVEDPALGPQIAGALGALDDSFFAVVLKRDDKSKASFAAAWTHIMDSVADDPKRIDAEQLFALTQKMTVLKQFSPTHEVPAAVAADARRRVEVALAKKMNPYARATVVEAAAEVYMTLGDDETLATLANTEVKSAQSPYYYMSALAETEEQRGDKVKALQWYERAYETSKGAATRFQWGSAYLSALLRLTPDDRERIRSTGYAVIAELDGPDRIQARTRVKLAKLDLQLRKWGDGHKHDGDLRALRTRLDMVCAKLPSSDPGKDSCRQFLQGSS